MPPGTSWRRPGAFVLTKCHRAPASRTRVRIGWRPCSSSAKRESSRERSRSLPPALGSRPSRALGVPKGNLEVCLSEIRVTRGAVHRWVPVCELAPGVSIRWMEIRLV
jgi:hypothetical protein